MGYHSNRNLRRTNVIGKHHKGKREDKIRSLSHLPKVKLNSCVRATRWMVDNDESGAMTAAETIALTSRSLVALDLSLPFRR